eukprot:NODE_27_length_33950_cov_0.349739.p11 type:complete len:351 gc:universal NODE_27_length_33950_cov_0.349739:424-1476(+)
MSLWHSRQNLLEMESGAFNIFANALAGCHDKASLFTEALLSELDSESLIYWVFKYYTIHYKNDEPIAGIVDSNINCKNIEWIQCIFNATIKYDDLDLKFEADPLHDDTQCIYLFALLCQGKAWDDSRIHETWKVLYEGNKLLQINEYGELVGNPCRAIHQRVARKMIYLTTKSSCKRLLSIIGSDFNSLMMYVNEYLTALWSYFYMEREVNRIKTLFGSQIYFKSEYDVGELPGFEEFLENLKCSKNNNIRHEANEPFNIILSAVLASSELIQIEKLCTRKVYRHEDQLKLEFTDFNDDVLLLMIHIVLIFQFEGMDDLFLEEWAVTLFNHFLDLLVSYDLVRSNSFSFH